MSETQCKSCGVGEISYIEDASFGESEKWGCDNCDAVVIVPVTLKRHFDFIDWGTLVPSSEEIA